MPVSDKTLIHESSYIADDVNICDGVKIWHFCHIRENTSIGENTVLGQNCMVGPNVRIGKNCRFQNNISVYDGLIIHDNVFVGPSAVFTNVINPRAGVDRSNEFKRTVLNTGVSIGANATIICGTSLGKNSFVAAGAVVTKDVKPNALVAGVPAIQIGWMSDHGVRLDDDLICKETGIEYFVNQKGYLYKKPKYNIAIITYEKPHLKTQLVAKGLFEKGYNFDFILTPFKKFKERKPVFNHRPYMWDGDNPEELADKFGSNLYHLDEWDEIESNYDYFILAGANILRGSKYFKSPRIINCHSGLIPETRGLDSLKWAIHRNRKVGNTLHFIDDQIDFGEIIAQKETFVLSEHDMDTFANEHFNAEISMLVEFEDYLTKREKVQLPTELSPTMRMPSEIELDLESDFERFKKTYQI